MILFRSFPTLLCLLSAVLLTVWKTTAKKHAAACFAGALCTAGAVVFALVDGANLHETLGYLFFLLLISLCRNGSPAPDAKRCAANGKSEDAP